MYLFLVPELYNSVGKQNVEAVNTIKGRLESRSEFFSFA